MLEKWSKLDTLWQRCLMRNGHVGPRKIIEIRHFWTPFGNVARDAIVILMLEKWSKLYTFGYPLATLFEVQWLFWCSKSDRNVTLLDTLWQRCVKCNGYFGTRKAIEIHFKIRFLTPFCNVAWGAMVILVLEKWSKLVTLPFGLGLGLGLQTRVFL